MGRHRPPQFPSIINVLILVFWCAWRPCAAALPHNLGRPVIKAKNLGVVHLEVQDAANPSTTRWHVFARCTLDAANTLQLNAFILKQTQNTSAGALGFPVGLPDEFVQLGDGATLTTLPGASRVLHPVLHPAHIQGSLGVHTTPTLHIQVCRLLNMDAFGQHPKHTPRQAATNPLSLLACVKRAEHQQPAVLEPSYYIIYAGVQGLGMRLASHILAVHAQHYAMRGVTGIKLYLPGSHIGPLRRAGGLHTAMDSGFVQVVRWTDFEDLLSHPRYLHAIAKHHAGALCADFFWL